MISCLLAACLFAPPKTTYFFPAGGARGESVSVTANGTFSSWPVSVRIERPGLDVTAAEKKGEFTFRVGDDAEPGTYWVRLYDATGGTALRPFIVGVLGEVLEVEPNDRPSDAQPLPPASVVNGRLSKRGEVDTYRVELTQGQTLVAALTAHAVLNSPMDSVMQVCDASGFVLEQNDDCRGLDPRIVFQAPTDGEYIVRLFAFPSTPNSTIGFAGADAWIYRLTVTTGGFIDHCLPTTIAPHKPTTVSLFGWNLTDQQRTVVVEPADTGAESRTVFHPSAAGIVDAPLMPDAQAVEESTAAGEPIAVTLPAVVSGRISTERESDSYAFPATKGQKLEIRVESRSLDFPLDAVLRVIDSSGKVLSETDDVSKRADPSVVHSVAGDGDLRVTVHDLHGRGGLRYIYRLSIAEQRPEVELVAGGDTFVLKPDESVEIPVTVTRKNGFAEKLVLTVDGLPEGVTAAPVESTMGDKSEKAVKVVVTGNAPSFSGPIRITARAGEADHNVRFPITGMTQQHATGWLTAIGQ